MTFQSSCLFLSLLTVLGAGGATSATAAPRSCAEKTNLFMAKCHVIVRNGDPSGRPIDKSEDDEVLTFEGCIPAWVYENPQLEIVKEDGCEACPDSDEKP